MNDAFFANNELWFGVAIGLRSTTPVAAFI